MMDHYLGERLRAIGYGVPLCTQLRSLRYWERPDWSQSKWTNKFVLKSSLWTKFTVIAIPGSFIFWLGFIAVYATVAPKLNFSTEFLGVIPHLFPTAVFWATVLLLPAICLIRDFTWK